MSVGRERAPATLSTCSPHAGRERGASSLRGALPLRGGRRSTCFHTLFPAFIRSDYSRQSAVFLRISRTCFCIRRRACLGDCARTDGRSRKGVDSTAWSVSSRLHSRAVSCSCRVAAYQRCHSEKVSWHLQALVFLPVIPGADPGTSDWKPPSGLQLLPRGLSPLARSCLG